MDRDGPQNKIIQIDEALWAPMNGIGRPKQRAQEGTDGRRAPTIRAEYLCTIC